MFCGTPWTVFAHTPKMSDILISMALPWHYHGTDQISHGIVMIAHGYAVPRAMVYATAR